MVFGRTIGTVICGEGECHVRGKCVKCKKSAFLTAVETALK
jgi:hypothetical protein